MSATVQIVYLARLAGASVFVLHVLKLYSNICIRHHGNHFPRKLDQMFRVFLSQATEIIELVLAWRDFLQRNNKRFSPELTFYVTHCFEHKQMVAR